MVAYESLCFSEVWTDCCDTYWGDRYCFKCLFYVNKYAFFINSEIYKASVYALCCMCCCC